MDNSMPVIDFNESQDAIGIKYLELPESVRLSIIKTLLMNGMYEEFSILENAVYNHSRDSEKFASSAWCGAIAWVNELR